VLSSSRPDLPLRSRVGKGGGVRDRRDLLGGGIGEGDLLRSEVGSSNFDEADFIALTLRKASRKRLEPEEPDWLVELVNMDRLVGEGGGETMALAGTKSLNDFRFEFPSRVGRPLAGSEGSNALGRALWMLSFAETGVSLPNSLPGSD